MESFINYLKYEKRFSEHTLNAYEVDLKQFKDYLYNDGIRLEEVNHHHIRTWIMYLSENKFEKISINRKVACLKSFYKYLHKENKITINPTIPIKSLKTPSRLPSFFSETETASLFKIVFENNFEGKRDYLVLAFLYGTGIRRAELIQLKHNQVDLENFTLKVIGKGNKERIIPMHQELVNNCTRYIEEKKLQFSCNPTAPFIVIDSGEQLYPVFVNRLVKKYLSQVSSKTKCSPHVLRHTFATHILNNGADLNAVKELLGHVSLSATQIYTHNTVEKLKDVFKKAHPKA